MSIIAHALHRLRPSGSSGGSPRPSHGVARGDCEEAPAAAPPAFSKTAEQLHDEARGLAEALRAKNAISLSFDEFWHNEGQHFHCTRAEAFVIWRAAWWHAYIHNAINDEVDRA